MTTNRTSQAVEKIAKSKARYVVSVWRTNAKAIAEKYKRMEEALKECDRVIVLTTRDPMYLHEQMRHVREALSFDPLPSHGRKDDSDSHDDKANPKREDAVVHPESRASDGDSKSHIH